MFSDFSLKDAKAQQVLLQTLFKGTKPRNDHHIRRPRKIGMTQTEGLANHAFDTIAAHGFSRLFGYDQPQSRLNAAVVQPKKNKGWCYHLHAPVKNPLKLTPLEQALGFGKSVIRQDACGRRHDDDE